ncbi:MAG: 4Fe-4S dicluster domain-containing protein [Desulfopila sp.]
MVYEFKVSDLAEEFGVHRNTIRNWINAGTLPAREGPGRKYIMRFADYQALCEKFGRALPAAAQATVRVERVVEKIAGEPIVLGTEAGSLVDDPALADSCLTCGSCASGCPIAGVDGLDPRKIVRMAVLGMDDELVESSWPWKCTLCGKCEESCPAAIDITTLMRKIRGARERSDVPRALRKGLQTCLERGNNLGIPKDDFSLLCETLGDELAGDDCPGFVTPLDVHGARVLVTVNSKVVFAEPDNLKWWWKILYAASESWTIASEFWEGVNWGFYVGDDEAMRIMVGRLVDNMRRLNCKMLLLPESGHAYFATRYGLTRWFPEALNEFRILTVFDLLLEYLREGRITLDVSGPGRPAAYHDPCYYGRNSQKVFGQACFEEPREILRRCGLNLRELVPSGNGAYCCGAGGGAWSMPYAEERVFHGRIKARQIRESGVGLIVTSCHNCRDQIHRSLIGEYDLAVEVKYLWEEVAGRLILPGTR